MPPHPGPPNMYHLGVLVQNLTSISTYLGALDTMLQTHDADAAFIQEVSAPIASLGTHYADIKGLHYKAHLSGPDPELSNVTAGVGVVYRNTKALLLQPVTAALRDATKGGRVQLIGIPLPGDTMLIVANIYGWTNAHFDIAAAARTDSLIDLIWKEFQARPPGPRMITGDLNGDPTDFSTLQALLSDGSLIDLGMHSGFHAPTGQPTCFPYNNGAPSRRDYVFISSEFLPFVSNFEVVAPCPDTLIPVHACLKIDIDFPMTAPTKTVLTKPPSLYDWFLDILMLKHGITDPKMLTVKQKGAGRQVVRDSAARVFEQQADDLYKAHLSGNTSLLWRTWSSTAMSGIYQGLEDLAEGIDNVALPPKKYFQTYGNPKLAKVPLYAKVRHDPDKVVAARVHRGVPALRQYRRAQTLANTLRKHIKTPSAFHLHQLCTSQWAAIQSHVNDFDHCLTPSLSSFVASPFVF